jgi:hypothetical protein
MAHSKAKLKSDGDRTSPYFSPFWIGNLSDLVFIFTPRQLYLWESHPSPPDTHWTAGGVGLRGGPDAMANDQ